MSKLKYIVFLILLTKVNAEAQQVIGIEAGTTFSSLQFPRLIDYSPSLGNGLKIGVNYLYKLNNTFDIESGIFVYQKGQKNEYKQIYLSNPGIYNDLIVKESFKLDYIEVPVNLNYNFRKMFISGGLYFSYGMEAYYLKEDKYYQDNRIVKEIHTKENISVVNNKLYLINELILWKRFDYGLCLGIGYRIKRFSIKTNFDLGVPYILTHSTPGIVFAPDVTRFRNRSVSVSLTYYLSTRYYIVRDTSTE